MKTRLMLFAMATTCGALAAATPSDAQPLPGEALPAWTQVASSCVVDEESDGRYTLTGPDFSYRGLSGVFPPPFQPLTARCNVTNPLPSGNPRWNRLIVTYRDYDLGCEGGRVLVNLYRVPRVASDRPKETLIATFNSDTFGGTCPDDHPLFPGRMREDAVAFSHRFDFLNNGYRVEIQLRWHNEDAAPVARMVRLARVVE